MSGEPPFSLADFLDEAGIDPENIDADETERINEALADLNPELYGTGGGDSGGDAGPPTLDGSLDNSEFPGGSLQEFGASISAGGNTAVVGAPGSDLGDGSDEGVAQVFERSNGSFQQVATLTASQPGDRVGENVDVDGNVAVVGAPGTGAAGEVYVYEKTGGTWNTTPEIALSNADNLQDTGPSDDRPPELDPQPPSNPNDPTFGSILAIEDDTIVAIGRPGGSFSNTGLLQFRPRQSGQGSSWVYIDQFVDLLLPTDVATDGGLSLLTNTDPNRENARVFPVGVTPNFERFGPEQDDTISDIPGFGALGDITDPAGSNPTAFVGAEDQVVVYEAISTGGQLPDFPNSETATLKPSTGVTGAGFGTSSVAADGTDVVVGAPGETTSGGTGAVYQFQRSSGSWGQNRRITAPSGVVSFGTSLSLGSNTIYVGDGSNVYTFAR
jgi:hypothetical protein